MNNATRWRHGRPRGCVLLAVGSLALAGCDGETSVEPESAGDEAEEVVAAAASALQEPTCVTVRRGVFGNIRDTFLSGDNPGWAPGSDWGMWTGRSSGGNQNRALLAADLAFLSEYSIVVSATLMIPMSWSDTPSTLRVHRVTQPWSEATASLQSFGPGGFDPAVAASFSGVGAGFQAVDLTELVSDWVRGVHPNYGVLVEEDPITAHYFFTSEVSVNNRPSLAVCYRNGPKPHRGGALVAAGGTGDSEGHHFLGSLSQGPGSNAVSTSENHRFLGGLVGATQP